jgi:twitching motility protein PilT
MQTMDMALQNLVSRGLVAKEEAQAKSANPNLFGGGFAMGGVAAAGGQAR